MFFTTLMHMPEVPFSIGDLVEYKTIRGHVAFIMKPEKTHINYCEGCITVAIPPSNVRIVIPPSDYSLVKPLQFMDKTVTLSANEIDTLIQCLYHMKDTLKDMTDLDDDKANSLASCYQKLVNAGQV